jgi:hypothetical protein
LGASDNAEPLHPIPARGRREADPTIVERISRLGPNPTGTSVTELVRETLPLNQKQFLVVRKILSHAIRHDGKLTLDAKDQMLFAVAGEGGVGKTLVIKAVELGLGGKTRSFCSLRQARPPTTSVGVPSNKFHLCSKPTGQWSKPQIYSLWQGKTILFIDEVSMVSLTMLNTINQQCNRIWAVGQDSTAILGALPIVVFMGDIHQIAPIKAQPLWETPKKPLDSWSGTALPTSSSSTSRWGRQPTRSSAPSFAAPGKGPSLPGCMKWL